MGGVQTDVWFLVVEPFEIDDIVLSVGQIVPAIRCRTSVGDYFLYKELWIHCRYVKEISPLGMLALQAGG